MDALECQIDALGLWHRTITHPALLSHSSASPPLHPTLSYPSSPSSPASLQDEAAESVRASANEGNSKNAHTGVLGGGEWTAEKRWSHGAQEVSEPERERNDNTCSSARRVGTVAEMEEISGAVACGSGAAVGRERERERGEGRERDAYSMRRGENGEEMGKSLVSYLCR